MKKKNIYYMAKYTIQYYKPRYKLRIIVRQNQIEY